MGKFLVSKTDDLQPRKLEPTQHAVGFMRHEALLDGLPPAAISFFAVFSRFEYALKRAGYFQRNKVGAQADWDKLAREFGQTFLMRVRASGEAGTLLDEPPKKQVIKDGSGPRVPTQL